MNTVIASLSEIVHTLYGIDFTPEISPAPKPELGEYCTNVFLLAKILGESPNTIAEAVTHELVKESEVFVSGKATGGYVNFSLTDRVWHSFLLEKDTRPSHRQNGKTILVDYIGANVGKPLHIGHICTPSIGQALCNIYRFLEYSVIGDSHFGDWGGIFGKLIWMWKIRAEYEPTESRLEKEGIRYLVELYQAFHAIDDTTLKEQYEERARNEFLKLSQGDAENITLWRKFTAISLAETEKKLALLNIHADYNIGESFYEGIDLPRPNHENYPDLTDSMRDIVEELLEKKIATKNDDGSVGVIFPEDTKMPSCILQKKDGTGLYLTSDLAAIKYRLMNWKPEKMIYSVDIRQQLHLKQAFSIAKHAWKECENTEFFHAYNGFIKLKEGAMSTRHGTVIFLEDLINEGFARTRKILETKGKYLSEADTEAIAIGAIKYSYLSQDREKDVVFDWDKALSFEGNSGPYIQYTFVRAKKIREHIGAEKQLKKYTLESMNPLQSPDGEDIGHEDKNYTLSLYDKSLIQTLLRFDEAVALAAKTYKPHHLALYAYDLAGAFNSFYVHTPKILEETDTDLKEFRLSLIERTQKILEKSFELLAIRMPSEM